MNINQRKKELYEKHVNIFHECNKLKENLNLALEQVIFVIKCLIFVVLIIFFPLQSQSVISNTLQISDTDLLKQYAKIYNYLNNLHLELIDVNCKLELYFQNSGTNLNSFNGNIIQNTKQLLLSNFLNNLNVAQENGSTISSSSSKEVCSSDSLSYTKEKVSENVDVQPNLNKTTSFKEIFDTKNSDHSGFFLHEIKSEEHLKNFTILSENKSTKIVEENPKESVETDIKKKRRRSKKKVNTVHSDTTLSSASYYSDQNNELNAQQNLTTIPFVRYPKNNDYCCMGYVESPSNFYIQLVCEEATYIEG